ncbi:acetamidase/formamidase family protein [Gryllotalpicola reticulitermitis]|uniref:Acetamidase/formamidase family protein n=1 Tax=Gryllotalpicola reticulitermitis TaxID=1184153 RepID=A0ABV8Q7Q6_9MICO
MRVHLSRGDIHLGWDNSIEPRATIAPGGEIELDLLEASGGQLAPSSEASDLLALDGTRLNPVTGPIRVDGARPGDALVISFLELDVDEWGWSGVLPGFGLLAADFPEPYLAVSRIVGGVVRLPFGVELPAVSMIGTIGVELPEAGQHSVIPPRRFGGNLDIRHLTAGATLTLPVGVEGALLSVGDAHAAMGDGEVCGTGVETNARTRLRIQVVPGASPAFPRFTTHPASDRVGATIAATGIGPSLEAAARDATRGLIDEIVARSRLAPVEAYVLASVAGDLKISEIVDLPNYVVSAHLPLSVLD